MDRKLAKRNERQKSAPCVRSSESLAMEARPARCRKAIVVIAAVLLGIAALVVFRPALLGPALALGRTPK